MNNTDQDRWTRVRERLRAEVGEDVFKAGSRAWSSKRIEGDTVQLSVPTRFLKSWIQSHYADRVLACWQAEQPTLQRIELTVRSAVLKPLPPKAKAPESRAHRARHGARSDGIEIARARRRRSRPCTKRSAARRSIRG